MLIVGNASGMAERCIASFVTLLGCDLAGDKDQSSWPERIPKIQFFMNSQKHSGTGHSPWFLEMGREPRTIETHALDSSGVPKKDKPWVQTLRERLAQADILRKRVQLEERAKRTRVEQLPYDKRRAPITFEPGDFAYLRVEQYARNETTGSFLVPRFVGPFYVRGTKAGHKHRYLLSRTPTSISFDAHVTRLKRCSQPEGRHGVVAWAKMQNDGVGAGRGFHMDDTNETFEIL